MTLAIFMTAPIYIEKYVSMTADKINAVFMSNLWFKDLFFKYQNHGTVFRMWNDYGKQNHTLYKSAAGLILMAEMWMC